MKPNRQFALISFILLVFLSPNDKLSMTVAAELDVWIATGNRCEQPAGIYHLKFDDETGKLSPPNLMAKREDTGFIAMHPTLNVLYATGESLSAWNITRHNGEAQLELINEQPTGTGKATHVSVDPSGQVLMSAFYHSGSICVFPLNDGGAVGEVATKIKHDEPSNVIAKRQDACHPHWMGTSPDGQFAFVPDLGADQVFAYRLEAATGTLTRVGAGATPPGGGPRHFVFHPTLPVGYVVNELAMSLSVMNYDSEHGELTLAQTIPTLSKEQIAGESFNSGSEVRVHPSGKFVYAGNRGHDSISAFAVNQSTGQLSLIEQEPIRGCWPRNFNLDPSGKWLLAAGAQSHTLSVFKIDQQTGGLQYARSIASVPSPICVLVEPKEQRK